jgi:hypothetical protein
MEREMSADKHALENCVDDLWRIADVLRDNLDGPEPVGDAEQLDDVVRALVGIAAARRRRLKIRSRLTGPRPVRAREIAASIDLDKGDNDCRPAEDPYSTDPVDWARAFLKSRDWRDDERTYCWFYNAMHAANPDAAIPEDPFWDDFPLQPHGRPPSANGADRDD